MDYKLAANATGDTIVKAIRSNDILTDILFYSSDEVSMITAIQGARPPIDGIYFTKRDYEVFTEKVSGLITKIIRRSEDLVNLRGFVLDGACDFEVRIKEALNAVWQKLSDQERALLNEATQRNICKNDCLIEKTRKTVMENTPLFPAAVNHRHFFSHSDRLYLLTKVIGILQENYGFSKTLDFCNFKSNYESDVSVYRNALGHKKSNEDRIEIGTGNYVDIDETLHQKMRVNLQQYDTLILQLENFIISM